MLCAGLLVIMFCQPEKAPVANDSFCQSYQRVIASAGDGKIMASLPVKRRLAANEILYRCKCEKWQSPLCPKE